MSSSALVPLVIIADDVPEDIVRIEQALAATGQRHKVIALPSGESAMNYLQRWLAVPPGDIWLAQALLVLDWRMPAAGGRAVLQWVRAQPRLAGLKVVAVTDPKHPADATEALAAGAMTCLSKSAPVHELTETLGAALSSSDRAIAR